MRKLKKLSQKNYENYHKKSSFRRHDGICAQFNDIKYRADCILDSEDHGNKSKNKNKNKNNGKPTTPRKQQSQHPNRHVSPRKPFSTNSGSNQKHVKFTPRLGKHAVGGVSGSVGGNRGPKQMPSWRF